MEDSLKIEKLGLLTRTVVAGLLVLMSGSRLGLAQDAGSNSQNLPAAPSTLVMGANPLAGGVVVERASAGALPLGLDDAIQRGLAHNLQAQIDVQNERAIRGEVLSVGNALLPSLTAVAHTDAKEINLAAMGFKPGSIKIPGFNGNIPEIVKVKTTGAQLNVSQQLFNAPAYELYRAAQRARDVASLATLNNRGGIVISVGTQYLRTLADASEITNAAALLKADKEVLRQATERHDAGVGINLDVLRAQVQEQRQEQILIRDEVAFAKDKIALNRLIGLPAEQELTLTDVVPMAELAELPLEQARALAYTRRKDFLELEAEMVVADRSRRAAKYERLPTLVASGYYGVLGETRGLYHGIFTAQGTVKIPIFQEAQFRGEREVAEAQIMALRQQIEGLRVTIDAQIRASRLDVESSAELVKVARSNVVLAGQEVDDATQRFVAGVDDSLPVVQAQATLAGAQSQLVQVEFQYNSAKLSLARNTGVVETQYKDYLGR